MNTSITVNWGALALRGVAALILGIACFVLTGAALVVLIALFAVYLLLDGGFALAAGVRSKSWFMSAEGVVGILAGATIFIYPGLTALILAYLIAVWAVVTGILEISAAFRLRRIIANEWSLALGGILSILFGVLIAIFPGAGLVTIVYLIGAYAILAGILLLVLALTLRSHRASHMMAA